MKVVFISGCWPGSSKGYEFAVDSDLTYLRSLFKEIYFIGPDCEQFNADFQDKHSDIAFFSIDFRRESQATRFLKSLFYLNCPATSIRYKRGGEKLINKLSSLFTLNEELLFVYQDVPCSILMEKIKKKFTMSKHVIRSHNVVFNGFLNMKKLPGLKGLAWKLELDKIKKLEIENLNSADLSYSISLDDKNSYEKMNVPICSVWPLRFDFKDYQEVKNGDSKTIIHVGTADLRKGADLKDFIDNCWPLVIDKVPDAKLIIAGKSTEKLTDINLNILGLGFVDHDLELLNKGGIFINPQKTGSGVKIKSIIAMASAKALVTTSVGIEGVDALIDENFILANGYLSQAEKIIYLLNNPNVATKIGIKARAAMHRNYEQPFILPDLESFAENV